MALRMIPSDGARFVRRLCSFCNVTRMTLALSLQACWTLKMMRAADSPAPPTYVEQVPNDQVRVGVSVRWTARQLEFWQLPTTFSRNCWISASDIADPL